MWAPMHVWVNWDRGPKITKDRPGAISENGMVWNLGNEIRYYDKLV